MIANQEKGELHFFRFLSPTNENYSTKLRLQTKQTKKSKNQKNHKRINYYIHSISSQYQHKHQEPFQYPSIQKKKTRFYICHSI